MSQIYKSPGGGTGGPVDTLSAEGGAPTPPLAGNFNFSGNASISGAITFSTPSNGQMDATVRVDNTTIVINGANDLQVVKTSTWHTINSSQTANVGNSYVVTGAGAVVVTLPALGTNLGDTFTVYEVGTGTFQIAQNAGQQIQLGKTLTTSGVAGSITSQNTGDFITLVSNGGGAEWIAIPYNGNLQVV